MLAVDLFAGFEARWRASMVAEDVEKEANRNSGPGVWCCVYGESIDRCRFGKFSSLN